MRPSDSEPAAYDVATRAKAAASPPGRSSLHSGSVTGNHPDRTWHAPDRSTSSRHAPRLGSARAALVCPSPDPRHAGCAEDWSVHRAQNLEPSGESEAEAWRRAWPRRTPDADHARVVSPTIPRRDQAIAAAIPALHARSRGNSGPASRVWYGRRIRSAYETFPTVM